MTTYEEILDDPPPARAKPCRACPWRRVAVAGWLGPNTAEEWLDIAHSEAVVACHTSIKGSEDYDGSSLHQCAGSAIFRANVFKLPRRPDIACGPRDPETVFESNIEFTNHHYGVPQ